MPNRSPSNWRTRPELEQYPPLNGEMMDRINNRIAHIYGYAVCLTAIIVMFFATKQIIDATINLTNPLRADLGGYSRMGLPLTNFELYKVEARRRPRFPMYAPAPGMTTP